MLRRGVATGRILRLLSVMALHTGPCFQNLVTELHNVYISFRMTASRLEVEATIAIPAVGPAVHI